MTAKKDDKAEARDPLDHDGDGKKGGSAPKVQGQDGPEVNGQVDPEKLPDDMPRTLGQVEG